VSPVDELAKQIKIEFDFRQEAAVMNSIGDALEVWHSPRIVHLKNVVHLKNEEGQLI
jgi:hypothetical protein